jgi:hypothetical protein
MFLPVNIKLNFGMMIHPGNRHVSSPEFLFWLSSLDLDSFCGKKKKIENYFTRKFLK